MERELAAVKPQTIDEPQVALALSTFDSVWDTLFPAEQARILGLLTEGITYDGRSERLAIKFRPDGVATLAADRPS